MGPQLTALADEFTVVAWDEPGAGRSSDVSSDFGLGDYASCLAAVIEALGLGPAHVAGLSWGSTVVQEVYRRHPRLVATLILIGAYASWKGSLPADEVAARVEGVRQMLAAPAEDARRPAPGARRPGNVDARSYRHAPGHRRGSTRPSSTRSNATRPARWLLSPGHGTIALPLMAPRDRAVVLLTGRTMRLLGVLDKRASRSTTRRLPPRTTCRSASPVCCSSTNAALSAERSDARLATALDEPQASAGARSVPVLLLHPW